MIGVTSAHGERIAPGRPGHEAFLGIVALRARSRDVRVLAGAITEEALAPLRALLLGAPAEPLDPTEVTHLERWVERGGRLLVVGSGPSFLDGTVGFGAGPSRSARVSLERLLGEPGTITVAEAVPVRAPGLAPHSVYARVPHGRGALHLLGTCAALADRTLAEGSARFAAGLAVEWATDAADEVAARLTEPQRHRLLHGYPMQPLLRRRTPENEEALSGVVAESIGEAPSRRVIVGVLPHTFCNPQVRGCGFCTFPHEAARGDALEETIAAVEREVRATRERRPVDALYLGGGTANLTPAPLLRSLLRCLREAFDLRAAEVTLEGVPVHFDDARLDALREELPPTARPRISMGIQTFDPAWLRRMGRTAFGDAARIEAAVRAAKDRGFAVSGDLLVNLPGQPREAMERDLDHADAIGLDQVCVYHLVLSREVGAEWSRDEQLLGLRPSNETACASWLALRERLLGRDFVQATLTNFERRAVHESPRRFVYEPLGFRPERYDLLGFGPGALSFRASAAFDLAAKLENVESARDYVGRRDPRERFFLFGDRDLRVLYATRRVATGSIDRAAYRATFRSDVTADFERELDALAAAGLVTIGESVALTARGTFYADTVAGVLAYRRVAVMRGIARAEGDAPGRISDDDRIENEAFAFRMG